MANDPARAEGYGEGVTSLVEVSRRDLRRSLERVGPGKAEAEGEAR
jgi:hypothetical protein